MAIDKLYIEYSEDPNWDYSQGQPSGNEPGWFWEEKFTPVDHQIGDKLVGPHKWRRERVGINSRWSYPQPIAGASIQTIELLFDSQDTNYTYYKVQSTYDNGQEYMSENLVSVAKGQDGKDAEASDAEVPGLWFQDEAELKAFPDPVHSDRYGNLSNQTVYVYNQFSTSGIKPDHITGTGRYEEDYTLGGGLDPTTIKAFYESNDDTNVFSDADNTKLDGVEDGAEVNVNADWVGTGDAEILNKPTDLTDLSSHTADELSDITSSGSGAIITSVERTKLNGIAEGAEINVKSDWTGTGDAEILNKPTDVTDLSTHSSTELNDITDAGSGEIITTTERADYNAHLADATLHFTEASIDHDNILNNGTNTHAQLDAFLASKGLANGLATLGADGKLPTSQIKDSSKAFVTVGANGEFTTLAAAFTAGFRKFVQRGAITDTDPFTPSTTSILALYGNKEDSVSISTQVSNLRGLDVKFVAALELGNGCVLDNCTTQGLTVSLENNRVVGGDHISIQVDGSNNEISSVMTSSAITVGTATGNVVANNRCDSEIIAVTGNTFTNNIEY